LVTTRTPVTLLDPLLGIGDAWSVIDAANRAWDGECGSWVSLYDERAGFAQAFPAEIAEVAHSVLAEIPASSFPDMNVFTTMDIVGRSDKTRRGITLRGQPITVPY